MSLVPRAFEGEVDGHRHEQAEREQ